MLGNYVFSYLVYIHGGGRLGFFSLPVGRLPCGDVFLEHGGKRRWLPRTCPIETGYAPGRPLLQNDADSKPGVRWQARIEAGYRSLK